MRSRSLVLLVVATLEATATGCSFVNAIDVCQRAAPADHDVNRRTEGRQYSSSPRSLGALPTGELLAVFSSEVSSDPLRHELRGVVLAPDGTPTRTCDSPDDDLTYAPADASTPAHQLFFGGVEPPVDERVGLLVWGDWRGETSIEATPPAGGAQVAALGISVGGCPAWETAPFQVSDDPPDRYVADVVAVRTSGEIFVVVWASCGLTSAGCDLRARVVTPDVFGPQFLPTHLDPSGGAASIIRERPQIGGLTAVRTSAGVLVAWSSVDVVSRTPSVEAMVLDDTLRIVGPQRTIYSAGPRAVATAAMDSAFDGESALVAFGARADDGPVRVFAARLTPGGEPLGASATVGAGGGDEWMPGVAALDSGFFVTWQRRSAQADDEGGASIEGILLDGEGAPRFANPACGSEPFRVDESEAGDQLRPAGARGADGSVAVLFNDFGGNGTDRSDGALRARVFAPRDLMPLE